MEVTGVRKTTLFLFDMNIFRVQTPGKVNSLYSLRYILVNYYIQYNNTLFCMLSWKIMIQKSG